ncbi:hypothetical protein COCSADRAFT_170267 [Bipolaris sorokiniana ND90Pr]|uniref:Uncharacterized protein n=1 Tax=Cochliobolus sativus (strain ND90Pr / ATCC 201652) TaxID=665912 RepID=M2TA56_COCSN|nr:uncharacterized protein COCSADRAFT_170267 [Bipolaris sorokiniana ND90Pr]EMD65802.1 hypothetical protein COCSADRAFT_170267 [Bipolaris sorokiniana ND90Pr]
MSHHEASGESTCKGIGVPLLANLKKTPALQKDLEEIAPLLRSQSRLQGITKLKDGVFAYRWISEFERLRSDILNSEYKDLVTKTGRAVREPEPHENAYPRAAVLLLHEARLHTSDDEIFLLQCLPIDKETHEAIIHRILEMDPTSKPASVTDMNKKLLVQSLTAPNLRSEAPLQSDSLCLVLQNASLEMAPQLVPFLLVPRLTSKVE